jgi:hypothetical protein
MAIFPDGMARDLLVNILGATTTILSFEVATGGVVTDSVSGNIRPETTTVTVEAVLNPATPDIRKEYFPGADGSQQVFRGNVVSASNVFPDSVRSLNPVEGTCTWNGRSGKIEVKIPGSVYTQNIGEWFVLLFTAR